jgi:ATP-dependent Clp protease ATP-binding subunit ClpA
MFERFTERARQVVVLAQEEALTLKHNYIGTEHILLGLLREEEGLAARVLNSLDITVARVRAQVVRIVDCGDEVRSGQIPFTPHAKKALELSLREALNLGHNHIDTEHLLLGLVRQDEGVAAQILLDLDADPEQIRNVVMRALDEGAERQTDPRSEPVLAPHVASLIEIAFTEPVQELLRAAAARALQDKRAEIELPDLLHALAADKSAASALAKLLAQKSAEDETSRDG